MARAVAGLPVSARLMDRFNSQGTDGALSPGKRTGSLARYGGSQGVRPAKDS